MSSISIMKFCGCTYNICICVQYLLDAQLRNCLLGSVWPTFQLYVNVLHTVIKGSLLFICTVCKSRYFFNYIISRVCACVHACVISYVCNSNQVLRYILVLHVCAVLYAVAVLVYIRRCLFSLSCPNCCSREMK